MAKVTILSKQSIMPSQPTCNSLPSISLSLLDQLSPPIYIHILFFYSTYLPDTSEKLKSSLSQTLNYFYPLAGRIRETGNRKLHVECNDKGVEFNETRVTGVILESIRKGPAVELFNELLPIKKSSFNYRENDPLLAVQINVLDGGGFVLGISICHLIADGASLSMFLNWWSHIANGFSENLSPTNPLPPRFDCASVFPPKEMTQNKPHKRTIGYSGPNQDVAIRCFSINSKAVERLKQVGIGQSTRVEAVCALVFRCIKRSQGENIVSMSHAVNLRKRMAPILLHGSFGNLWMVLNVESNNVGSIEQNIRRAESGVDEQFVRMKAQQMCDESVEEKERVQRKKGTESVEFVFSSWCRAGWYECNFGFEKQIWVACGITALKNVCVLMDAKDGQGMEVWLWMAVDEMERIESDHELGSLYILLISWLKYDRKFPWKWKHNKMPNFSKKTFY